ncbi:hypothetical protein Avbf_12848 [Armadillidium vulgare]|nr:hypothetical protein Avbf_12848 [Armadillidium vulgare]
MYLYQNKAIENEGEDPEVLNLVFSKTDNLNRSTIKDEQDSNEPFLLMILLKLMKKPALLYSIFMIIIYYTLMTSNSANG